MPAEAARLPAAVVLAGGRSTRMGGGDKSLELLGSRPLLAHVLDRLGPQASAVAISANGDAGRFSQFDRPVLADTVPGYLGPLAGLLAGMQWAQGLGATHILSMPTDTPFFPKDWAPACRGIARMRRGLPPPPAADIRRSACGRSRWPGGSAISCVRERPTRSPSSPTIAMPSPSISR